MSFKRFFFFTVAFGLAFFAGFFFPRGAKGESFPGPLGAYPSWDQLAARVPPGCEISLDESSILGQHQGLVVLVTESQAAADCSPECLFRGAPLATPKTLLLG